MDLVNLLLFCLISVVIGAVLMLLVQYYIFVKICDMPDVSLEQQTQFNERYSLPESIKSSVKCQDVESKYPIVAINLIMQFLFHELKNSNHVRKWFYRKLSLELDELITKTTTGKLFDKLTITDLDLGEHFPEIKNLRVHDAELHATEGRMENIEFLLDLNYQGNFSMTIDVDMVLGKKGALTLKVKNLSGLAQLKFTRKPYTHWSLCFLGDPQLDLDIESPFQGRQMQSNVASLISNQIRKAVRSKHTFPNYKLRYKPFFHKVEDDLDCEIQANGELEVKVSELSRLAIPSNMTDVYCTLTLSSEAWIEARQNDERNVILTLDVEIHKAKNQQIGIVFKQGEGYVEIEAILPNTPAIKANLKSGDILLSIDGQRANVIPQISKIMKSLNRSVLTLRIERLVPGIIRNDGILEDLELYEDMNETKQHTPEHTKTKTTKILKDKLALVDSNLSTTPSNSPKKSKSIAKTILKSLNKDSSDKNKAASIVPPTPTPIPVPVTLPVDPNATLSPEIKTEENKNSDISSLGDVEHYQQHATIDCRARPFIQMEDLCKFILDDKCNFLNVCVYGKCIEDSEVMLLSYINIPINSILAECSETNLGKLIKGFPLNPPTMHQDISFIINNSKLPSQSGFDPKLCFGDILLSFSWQGKINLNPIEEKKKSKSKSSPNAPIKPDDIEIEEIQEKCDQINYSPKQHNFIRTHFDRATQCDFCGKKIWLKDAVQCRDCSMCCHKKCINKCQNSTVCGPVDCSAVMAVPSSPEVILTEPSSQPSNNNSSSNNIEDDDQKCKTDAHRHSLSELLAQSIKRVNSANNLAIPGMNSPFSNNSKSLPPSPQHTPRKQSLVNQNENPFILVTQRLENISENVSEFSDADIGALTEPILGLQNGETIMSLAKSSSKLLYEDLQGNERVEKINILLSKLRFALDSETSTHSSLSIIQNSSLKPTFGDAPKSPTKTFDNNLTVTEKNLNVSAEKSDIELANQALLLGQSEERVQALSVIMLYLCTGLQHAQGVACN